MSLAPAQLKQTSLEDERRAHEPSMEEILASIRRIIADDETLPSPRDSRRQENAQAVELPASRPALDEAYPGPALGSGESRARPERLEAGPQGVVKEPMQHPAELAMFPMRIEPVPPAVPQPSRQEETSHPAAEAQDADAYYVEEAEANDPAYAAVLEDPAAGDVYDMEQTDAGEPADASPLVSPEAAASVASHFEALVASMFIRDSGLLQDYAKELLRPMLKQWLDDNLPAIVERLVRAEIERVARGGRR